MQKHTKDPKTGRKGRKSRQTEDHLEYIPVVRVEDNESGTSGGYGGGRYSIDSVKSRLRCNQTDVIPVLTVPDDEDYNSGDREGGRYSIGSVMNRLRSSQTDVIPVHRVEDNESGTSGGYGGGKGVIKKLRKRITERRSEDVPVFNIYGDGDEYSGGRQGVSDDEEEHSGRQHKGKGVLKKLKKRITERRLEDVPVYNIYGDGDEYSGGRQGASEQVSGGGGALALLGHWRERLDSGATDDDDGYSGGRQGVEDNESGTSGGYGGGRRVLKNLKKRITTTRTDVPVYDIPDDDDEYFEGRQGVSDDEEERSGRQHRGKGVLKKLKKRTTGRRSVDVPLYNIPDDDDEYSGGRQGASEQVPGRDGLGLLGHWRELLDSGGGRSSDQ